MKVKSTEITRTTFIQMKKILKTTNVIENLPEGEQHHEKENNRSATQRRRW